MAVHLTVTQRRKHGGSNPSTSNSKQRKENVKNLELSIVYLTCSQNINYEVDDDFDINKLAEDNTVVKIFESRKTYVANMEYFPNYKDGEDIFLLLNVDIMVINLQGQKKEFIKYTFCDIMVYPNDIILGVDAVNNIMILNPTR